MSTSLIYYYPSILDSKAHDDLPGIRELKYFSTMFNNKAGSMILLDRSGTIRTPIRLTSLFPIPALRPFNKTFEEICNDRAVELLARAETLTMPLFVFWSGGIDSTLVLISLLKNATAEQKKNIVVLMTEHSIAENPNFYRDHIHGKLRIDSSAMTPYIVGTRAIITNGDLNDPIFGMGKIGELMRLFGADIIHKPYAREKLFEYFNASTKNEAMTDLYLDLFERMMRNAPVPITTYFDYLWWINFSIKWQYTSIKMITVARRIAVDKITPAYLQLQIAPFYGTEDFQLWSMNNMDKKIKDEWRTFKWVCKDIIYEYTGDAEYRDNKLKTGSMRHIFCGERAFNCIDESMQFYNDLDPHEYYDPNNDFV